MARGKRVKYSDIVMGALVTAVFLMAGYIVTSIDHSGGGGGGGVHHNTVSLRNRDNDASCPPCVDDDSQATTDDCDCPVCAAASGHPNSNNDDDAVVLFPSHGDPQSRLMEWGWHRFDSLYYNMNATLAQRVCTRANNDAKNNGGGGGGSGGGGGGGASAKQVRAFCARAAPLSPTPHVSLMRDGGDILLYWPRKSRSTKSTGSWGLHYLPKTLMDLGAPSYMWKVTNHWNEMVGGGLREHPVRDFNNLTQTDEQTLVVIKPELQGMSLKKVPQLRMVGWLLGFHRSVAHLFAKNPLRRIGNVHHSQKMFMGVGAQPLMVPMHFSTERADAWRARRRSDGETKLNWVLYDTDIFEIEYWERLEKDLRKDIPDARVMRFVGFNSVKKVLELYEKVKVTIDFDMPGSEAINFEGTKYECIPVIGNRMIGYDNFDLPIPSFYKVDKHNYTQVLHVVRSSLLDYKQRVDDTRLLREKDALMPAFHRRDAGMHFFTRSMLFYTVARSVDELRAIAPFILGVMNVATLAKIEILVPSLTAFRRDQDALLRLMDLQKYGDANAYLKFTEIPANRTHDLPDALLPFVLPPRSKGHVYTVVADVGSLFLGRDVLNAYAKAMLDNDLPILSHAERDATGGIGGGAASPFTMMRSERYWKEYRCDFGGDDDAYEAHKHARDGPPLEEYLKRAGRRATRKAGANGDGNGSGARRIVGGWEGDTGGGELTAHGNVLYNFFAGTGKCITRSFDVEAMNEAARALPLDILVVSDRAHEHPGYLHGLRAFKVRSHAGHAHDGSSGDGMTRMLPHSPHHQMVLYYMPDWRVDLDELRRRDDVADLVEMLDPLVHQPMWMQLMPYMPVPYKELTMLRPRSYGRSSVLDA
jgi:hypothetical protein